MQVAKQLSRLCLNHEFLELYVKNRRGVESLGTRMKDSIEAQQ
jgi:hypothetical protein